jgi:hypothetical protein
VEVVNDVLTLDRGAFFDECGRRDTRLLPRSVSENRDPVEAGMMTRKLSWAIRRSIGIWDIEWIRIV